MTLKFASVLATAVVLTTAAVRAAGVPSDAQKAITADYAAGCTAALNPTDANIDAAFAFLSPDYIDIGFKGEKRTRDQVIAVGKQQMKQLHTTTCDPTTVSSVLNADGTITIVEGEHIVGTLQSTDGNHHLEVTGQSQDTWKQIKGTWMQTQSQETRNLVKMDGNVVQDEGH